MPETGEGTREPWEYSLYIPNDPRAVTICRRTLRLILTMHGLIRLVDVAELLATELVANAVCHTKGPAALRVRWSAGVLRIGAWDADPEPPEPPEASCGAGSAAALGAASEPPPAGGDSPSSAANPPPPAQPMAAQSPPNIPATIPAPSAAPSTQAGAAMTVPAQAEATTTTATTTTTTVTTVATTGSAFLK